MRNRDHGIYEVNDQNRTCRPDVIVFGHYHALKAGIEADRSPEQVCRISLQVKGLDNTSHSSSDVRPSAKNIYQVLSCVYPRLPHGNHGSPSNP
jgi:hypothetical protein